MDSSLKNALALIGGIIIGIIVLTGIMSLHGIVIPLPDGVNASVPNSITDNIHLFKAKHFVVPFIAHAVGTMVGAFVAAKFAVKYKMNFAIAVGAAFLVNSFMTAYLVEKTSLAFNITDFVFAYFPMAWIGGKLGTK